MPRPLAGALLAVTLIAASPAGADELTVLCPRGVLAPLAALAERFEADPGTVSASCSGPRAPSPGAPPRVRRPTW